MASFAVQAVQQVFGFLSDRRYNRKKAERGLRPGYYAPQRKDTEKATSHPDSEKQPQARKHKTYTSNNQIEVPRKSRAPFLSRPFRRSKNLDQSQALQQASEKLATIDRLSGMSDGIRDVVPHADLTEQWHAKWENRIEAHKQEGANEEEAQSLAREDVGKEKERVAAAEDTDDVGISNEEEMRRDLDEDTLLTERVLELAISLEWRARSLLIAHLGGGEEAGGDTDGESGHAARIILKADRNIQLRGIKGLLSDIENERKAPRSEDSSQGSETLPQDIRKPDGSYPGIHPVIRRIMDRIEENPHADVGANQDGALTATSDEKRTLEEVRLYREEFAGLLAAGSRLMKLKGVERALFERGRLKTL